MNAKRKRKIKLNLDKKKIISELLTGLAFLLIIFLVIFFLFFDWQGGNGSEPILSLPKIGSDKIESSNEVIESDLIVPFSPVLYLGSFGYTSANIDASKSDLYFDNVSSGVYFKPNIRVEKINRPDFSDTPDENNDKRCIDNDCLTLKDGSLSYNGRQINLPFAESIVPAGISIAALDDRFLVGFTLSRGSSFYGRLYFFKSGNFKEIILPEEAVSEEKALFGFGGLSEDFIVIYGSKSGRAYHFQNGRAKDISRFFSFRPMAGGFKPEVIRVENSFGVNWYVFSGTKGKISFIKLWQNGGKDIVGESVLTDFVGLRGDSAWFYLDKVSDSEISFFLKETALNGEENWSRVLDYGFIPSGGAMQSLEMPIYEGKKVNVKNIIRADIAVDKKYAPQAQYYFSTDGKNFSVLPTGNNLDFSLPLVSSYWLKLKLPPSENAFESPYLSTLSFDYAYERTD